MLGFLRGFETLVLGARLEPQHKGGLKDSASFVRPRSKESRSTKMTAKTPPVRRDGELAHRHSLDATANFRLAIPFIPELYNHGDLAMLIPPFISTSHKVPSNAFVAEQQLQRVTSPSLRPVLRTNPKGIGRTATVSFGPSLHYQPTNRLDPSHRYLSI
jgi:hypothetical protein